MKSVKVIGLQRSGTNYLEELIRVNYHCNITVGADTSICWKHSLPNERYKNSTKTATQSLKENDTTVILISKTFYVWEASIKSNGMDLYSQRGFDLNLNDLYRLFHSSWATSGVPVVCVDYLNLLFNIDKTLGVINLDRKTEEWVIPSSVYGSVFNNNRLKYYENCFHKSQE